MRFVTVLFLGALLLALPGFAAGPTTRGSTGTGPTHLSFVGLTTVTVGAYTSLMGVLHNSTANVGIPGATLTFSLRATFGSLPLGNATTNGEGKAAIDYRPVDPGTVTIQIDYAGNATYAPSNVTASLTILAGAAPPGGSPAQTIIVLIVLATVGGIWATYGFVAWQVLAIRTNAPARQRRTKGSSQESMVNRMSEGDEEQPKRAPVSAKPNRMPLVIGAAALAVALVAMVYTGISAQPRAPAYTPGTIELQVTIVPDMKGEGWDAWVPNELVVHNGDSVKLTVYNADPMEHGLKIDAFGIDRAIPAATENATGAVTPSETVVTFTVTQVGQFLIRCNVVCGDGHDEMTGTLVVLPD